MKELFGVVGGDKQEQPVPGPCGGWCVGRNSTEAGVAGAEPAGKGEGCERSGG